MAIIGAMLGDISGSQYEFNRPASPDTCPLFSDACTFTDDTVMTLAIKRALDEGSDLAATMREVGRCYPDCGYGGRFLAWLFSDDMPAYGSYGNGSAMRVSYVAEFVDDLAQVQLLARQTALVTHDHPEGVKSAEVCATCIWMARHGRGRREIYDYVLAQYPPAEYAYSIDRSIDELADTYTWDVSCMGSVPVAMRAFYESHDFESFMRCLFRLDCDTDTLGAIGGPVVEEFYRAQAQAVGSRGGAGSGEVSGQVAEGELRYPGFGFDVEATLRRYLDDRLLGILGL